MKTATKNSEISINYLVINFPASIIGDFLYVYNISSFKNIHHITFDKKFNKLPQETHLLN